MPNKKNPNGKIKTSDLETYSKSRIKTELLANIQALSKEKGRDPFLRGKHLENLVNATPAIIETLVSFMSDTLISGKCIRLKRVGSLSIIDKAERGGVRNPKTGEASIVKAHRTVSLRKSRANRSLQEVGVKETVEYLAKSYPEVNKKGIHLVYTLFTTLIEKIKEGRTRIEIRTLGAFSPSFVAKKETRNPQDGSKSTKEAHYRITFKLSTTVHKELN